MLDFEAVLKGVVVSYMTFCFSITSRLILHPSRASLLDLVQISLITKWICPGRKKMLNGSA